MEMGEYYENTFMTTKCSPPNLGPQHQRKTLAIDTRVVW